MAYVIDPGDCCSSHCSNFKCMDPCPVPLAIITRDPVPGMGCNAPYKQAVIDQDHCTECGACVEECPVGAIKEMD